MAMKYVKVTGWMNTSTYTSSVSFNPVDGTTLLILTQLRNNIYAHSGSEPDFAGAKFTRVIPQIGYQQIVSNEMTLEMFYLLNPDTGSNTLNFYQGIQGDGSTIQTMHVWVAEASQSAGKSIQLETATSSFQITNDPFIEAAASDGALVFNVTTHGDGTLSGYTASPGHSPVTKSDFGNWCGYSQVAIPSTGSGQIPFFWDLGNVDDTINILVSFKESDANVWNVVNFLHDEVPRY